MENKTKKVIKKISTILTILLSIVGFTILMYVIMYFSFSEYKDDCLESFAEEYCHENNLSFKSYENTRFFCSEEVDERLSNHEKSKSFYFLSSEKESCLIKKSWSFKKISNG